MFSETIKNKRTASVETILRLLSARFYFIQGSQYFIQSYLNRNQDCENHGYDKKHKALVKHFHGLSLRCNNFLTVVVIAIRAYSMRELGFVTLRTDRQRRCTHLHVRWSSLISSRFGCFPLRNCHCLHLLYAWIDRISIRFFAYERRVLYIRKMSLSMGFPNSYSLYFVYG